MSPDIYMPRLKERLAVLATFGRQFDNEMNKLIFRPSFTQSDIDAREWFIAEITNANLNWYLDGVGNIHVNTGHGNNKEKKIIIGSHIDVGQGGGYFDGALGALVGLEVIQSMLEHNVQIDKDVELIIFSDKEGRFEPLLGAKAVLDRLPYDSPFKIFDTDGESLFSATKGLNIDLNDLCKQQITSENAELFIEVHMEKGPVLASKSAHVGIVESFDATKSISGELKGVSNHASMTPSNEKKDAFLALCHINAELSRIVEKYHSNNNKVSANICSASIAPSIPNIIPHKVNYTLELQASTQGIIYELEADAMKCISSCCDRFRVESVIASKNQAPPLTCDKGLISTIKKVALDSGINVATHSCGETHHAKVFSSICPSTMLLVPTHKEEGYITEDYATWEDIEIVARLLLQTMVKVGCDNG